VPLRFVLVAAFVLILVPGPAFDRSESSAEFLGFLLLRLLLFSFSLFFLTFRGIFQFAFCRGTLERR